LVKKRGMKLTPDAYFKWGWPFILEFDEIQHFTSYKLIALKKYPNGIEYGFSIKEYIKYCDENHKVADKKYKYKCTKDFKLKNGGRAAQRAYLDSFRDLLPEKFRCNPTIRISEFEVENLCCEDGMIIDNDYSVDCIKKILKEKLELAGCPKKFIEKLN